MEGGDCTISKQNGAMDSQGNGWGPSDESSDGRGGDVGRKQRTTAEVAASERMRDAIAALAQGEPGQDQLRVAACELVAALRSKEQPPEKALVQIKKVLADAGLETPPMGMVDEAEGEVPSRDAELYRELIAWSIRCYYEGQ